MVGSHIQLQLFIGQRRCCQLYSTIYRKAASLLRQIATWRHSPALKGQHGTVANKSPSIVARILNRARRVLRHSNRVRFTAYLSATRQTRHISTPAQPFTLLLSSLCWAMLHLARHVHHISRNVTTQKVVGGTQTRLSRARRGRERGGTDGKHFLRAYSSPAFVLRSDRHKGRSPNTGGRP